MQRQRNSKLGDHFAGSGNDRAGDLGREGTQNAGDAVRPGGGPVRVRIAFGDLPADRAAAYAAGLVEHVPAIAHQKGMSAVATVAGDSPCRFLAFEDFNTTGLTGDPHLRRRYDGDEPNHFHTFFRAEGQTDKDGDTKQGSHGVGKVAFMAASHARAVLGLTCRDDGRELLFGTAVLHTHRYLGQDYDGDAWFGHRAGTGPVEPSEDPDALNRFREDFGLSRIPGETGFSIVVPWLDTDEVTPDHLIDAVLRSQSLPILQGKLVVEVTPTMGGPTITIDAAHYLSVLDARPDAALKSQLRPSAELAIWGLSHEPAADADRLALHEPGAPRWTNPLMSAALRDRLRAWYDAGDPIAVRVPIRIRPKGRGVPEVLSHFDVYLRQDPAHAPAAPVGAGATTFFYRGGLLISGEGRRLPGLRALVVVDHPGLAGLLRAAENPSHTRWNPKTIKEQYNLHDSTVRFVENAPRELAKLMEGDPAEKDASIWVDALAVQQGAGQQAANGGTGTNAKKGNGPRNRGNVKPTDIVIVPPKPTRPYRVVTLADGFKVEPSGRPFADPLPAELELSLAYHVRGKDPLTRWRAADFNLSGGSGIMLENVGCDLQSCADNRIVLQITAEDFEFVARGFDGRRELFCKPRLARPAVALVPAEEGADDGGGDEDVVVQVELPQGGAE